MQVQAFSGPTTDDVPVRASQPNKSSFSSLVQLASGSNEPGEGGRSKISGSVRQCNFHWWPRRSELQHLVEAKTKNCGCDGNKDSRNDGTIELNLSEPYRWYTSEPR